MNPETETIRLLTDENAKLRKACIAHNAWSLAEQMSGLCSFHDKMNLCSYAEWLTNEALAVPQDGFSGVPRLLIFPVVEIDRIDIEAAEALVERVLAAAAKKKLESP